METYWPLVNELEEAWTGVEERDRAIILNLIPQHERAFLIVVRLVRYTVLKAKRRYRYTFCTFQSQYGQKVILR